METPMNCNWDGTTCQYANRCNKTFEGCLDKPHYNGFPQLPRCRHNKTHYEEWPDGGDIEVCESCGMSRHHWEWGESDWTMIEDIEKARKQLQQAFDRLTTKYK